MSGETEDSVICWRTLQNAARLAINLWVIWFKDENYETFFFFTMLTLIFLYWLFYELSYWMNWSFLMTNSLQNIYIYSFISAYFIFNSHLAFIITVQGLICSKLRKPIKWPVWCVPWSSWCCLFSNSLYRYQWSEPFTEHLHLYWK